jgi:hypothetical protein
MSFISYVSLKHAFDESSRIGLLESLQPQNGYSLFEVNDEGVTYIHEDPRLSWSLKSFTLDTIDLMDELGQDLLNGGFGEYSILRYPKDQVIVEQDEAMAFWTKVLPVTPIRILFTWTELCCVFIQLTNGMIVDLTLSWKGGPMEDLELVKTIFLDIAKVNLTPQLSSL